SQRDASERTGTYICAHGCDVELHEPDGRRQHVRAVKALEVNLGKRGFRELTPNHAWTAASVGKLFAVPIGIEASWVNATPSNASRLPPGPRTLGVPFT